MRGMTGMIIMVVVMSNSNDKTPQVRFQSNPKSPSYHPPIQPLIALPKPRIDLAR